MRQMGGDGQHPVVMAGLHDLDLAAGPRPELAQPGDRLLVGAGRRGEDAPAPLEQLGEAGLGPGMLRAGHRMARDQMDALGDLGAQVADHRLLDRAHIADDGAGRQMVAHRRPDLGVGAERRAEHDEVGAGDGGTRRLMHAVEEAQLHRLVAGGLAARRAGDMAGEALALHHPCKGGADQPEADERHAAEERLAHRAAASVSAAARPPA